MLRWRWRSCTCAHTGRQRPPSIRLLLLPAHLLHRPHPHVLELLLLAEPFCVLASYWRTRPVAELVIGWTILWQCSVGFLYWPDSYVYDVPIGWRHASAETPTWPYPVLEFLNYLRGLGKEPSREQVCRTGPSSYIDWRNWFLGIDSWAPYKV